VTHYPDLGDAASKLVQQGRMKMPKKDKLSKSDKKMLKKAGKKALKKAGKKPGKGQKVARSNVSLI
jgi:hypothetical protein